MKNRLYLGWVLLVFLTNQAFCQSFELPKTLTLKSVEGISHSTISKEISKKDRVILVLFNPLCGHCITFLDSTRQHHDEFVNTKFIFIYGKNDELKGYFDALYTNMNLAAYDKFIFAHAPQTYFDQYRIRSLPSIYLYDQGKKHKFIKSIPLKEEDYSDFIQKTAPE